MDMVTLLLDEAHMMISTVQEVMAQLDLPDDAPLPDGIARGVQRYMHRVTELHALAQALLDVLGERPTVTFYRLIGHKE